MANVNVTYDQMRQEARALTTAKNDIQNQLVQLQNRIRGLISAGFVTDAASAAFGQTYDNFTTNATQTIESLESIANILNQSAQAFEDTDRQIAQQMG